MFGYVVKFLVAFVAVFALAASASAAPAPTFEYKQTDSNPDMVIISPNVPEGTRETTDLEWIKITANSNSKPKTIRMVFKVDEFSDVVATEVGFLMTNNKGKKGQIYASTDDDYVNTRNDWLGATYYCPNSSVKVVDDRIILHMTYFCLPFRTGALDIYINTFLYNKERTPIGGDGLSKTPVMSFKFKN